ncbi:putative pyridine nucleotide-disulfide oxidoreductase [Thiobacillus denitrificans ATCC 25259]|uniref:Putative pyridine nucleotide-disulfide oxidoreductase n=1 Tax=Thiobacillus denitrificans (strain ATCC 25259 / T1) TaxID=292415 RepID=Q3SIV0_THIDA|nr:mercuric reductase [Thiobacillus denitrificans]AAZ97425.1 putative pyridine nucleotide-disulfide oxidoreductase [Thiobacillus denitrificans ATCC 25259]
MGSETDHDNFDAVIVGAGQAAAPLAVALGAAGWRTAVVERRHVGGSCINFGCTPTKAMAASARVAALARRAAEFGLRAGTVEVDFPAVMQRARAIVARFRRRLEASLAGADNVELIFGDAIFQDARTLIVRRPDGESRTLAAAHVFINTGTRAALPPIPGLERLPLLHDDALLALETLPPHLLVIGGGYVGLEFAQMFRRFGSEVSLIQRDEQLAPREDPDVAEALREMLVEDGVKVYLEAKILDADRGRSSDGDSIALNLKTPTGPLRLLGSHLLVATGRRPNSDDLDLAAAGVETGADGYIRVNDRLETSAAGIYALGDVKGGPAFTHIAYDDARVLKTNLLGDGGASVADRPVPYTVFTDPQLGRIGLSEREARQSGRRVLRAHLQMAQVARAIETGEARGFVKALIDADSGEILGAAALGADGGELMAMLQLAMMGRIPYSRLHDAVFAHPTLAESLNALFAAPQPLPR